MRPVVAESGRERRIDRWVNIASPTGIESRAWSKGWRPPEPA